MRGEAKKSRSRTIAAQKNYDYRCVQLWCFKGHKMLKTEVIISYYFDDGPWMAKTFQIFFYNVVGLLVCLLTATHNSLQSIKTNSHDFFDTHTGIYSVNMSFVDDALCFRTDKMFMLLRCVPHGISIKFFYAVFQNVHTNKCCVLSHWLNAFFCQKSNFRTWFTAGRMRKGKQMKILSPSWVSFFC